MHMTRRFFLTRAGALGAVAALALTACGSQNTQIGQNTQTSPGASTSASATLVPITEGKLRIFDPATGAELGSVQLMEAWTESETWQDERPALWVDGKTAYVTDPATKKLIAVSLSSPAALKELMSVELPKTPNEILGVSSSNAAPVEAEAHGAEAHGSASSSASADAHESGEAHEGHSH